MKLLSVTVPCYNSEDYMKNCIESLLVGGERVEIIVVNDGSSDRTGEIGDFYAKQYPSIVNIIHQENGGHGEAVNTGLRNAKGIYFKVVDSDDWVKEEAYLKILNQLQEFAEEGQGVDMLLSNFVYEKEGSKKKRAMAYSYAVPSDQVIKWEQIKHFRKGQYILMHSVIYRTKLLRDCGLELPKHTFYVDNLFVFKPLPYVKSIYYVNVNFYRYYIGRSDQSVNEGVMISRVDQQIKVNKMMIDYFMELKGLPKKLKDYMISYLDIMMAVSSIMLIRAGTKEALEKKKELWKYLKKADKFLFYRLRFGLFGHAMNLPGRGGRKISVAEYKIAQRFFGFN